MKAESRFMWLALASSGSTLICCALPALLISLGAGAVLASMVSMFPALVWVSLHKPLVFGAAATMLIAGGYLQARPQSCPADPELAAACARYKRLSKYIYWASVGLFVIGIFFAFGLPALRQA